MIISSRHSHICAIVSAICEGTFSQKLEFIGYLKMLTIMADKTLFLLFTFVIRISGGLETTAAINQKGLHV